MPPAYVGLFPEPPSAASSRRLRATAHQPIRPAATAISSSHGHHVVEVSAGTGSATGDADVGVALGDSVVGVGVADSDVGDADVGDGDVDVGVGVGDADVGVGVGEADVGVGAGVGAADVGVGVGVADVGAGVGGADVGVGVAVAPRVRLGDGDCERDGEIAGPEGEGGDAVGSATDGDAVGSATEREPLGSEIPPSPPHAVSSRPPVSRIVAVAAMRRTTMPGPSVMPGPWPARSRHRIRVGCRSPPRRGRVIDS
jgi:hypothetical protein